MIARLALFVALTAAVGVQGDVNVTVHIPSTADPILQSVISGEALGRWGRLCPGRLVVLSYFGQFPLNTIIAGVQDVQPATQQVASSLLGKYQQTLQVSRSPSTSLTSKAMSELMSLCLVSIVR